MDAATSLRSIADYDVGKRATASSRFSVTEPIFCKSLEWSADGTCLVCTLSDGRIDTIVLPQDLLAEREEPHKLEVYSSIESAEPVKAVINYPGFSLEDASSALVLSSVRELPIRLHSALMGETLAAYPLINSMTEEYISPYSLCFSTDGRQFIAGSDSLISIFDISRPGQDPLVKSRTGSKRRDADMSNPGTSMRGIVSALNIDHHSNVLAAGTFSRSVGLYAAGGQGECIGAFSVMENDADKAIGGRGITQVLWSQCGRYLYVAERVSDGAMVYDIRKTGQLLSWIKGRHALTNQRLNIDIFNGNNVEIWAGGSDGNIRVWRDAHAQAGAVSPSLVLPAHNCHVPSAAVHRAGGVVASCSGQRYLHTEPFSKTAKDSYPHEISIWEMALRTCWAETKYSPRTTAQGAVSGES